METVIVTAFQNGVYHPVKDSACGGFIEFVSSVGVTITITEDNNMKMPIVLQGTLPYRIAMAGGQEILLDIPDIRPNYVRITWIPIWRSDG